MDTSLALILFILAAAANFGGMMVLTSLVGPKRPNPVKNEPFECGSLPLMPNRGRLNVRFYMIAMLFLIFDVEVVFLYPWAMIYKSELGLYGFVTMGFFLLVLVIGLIYEWKRGGMDWD